METLKLYITVLAVFAILDFCWLGLLMSGFYRTQLGSLVRTSDSGTLAPLWPAAVLVYLLLVVGIVEFVVPRVRETSLGYAFLWGGIFGVVVYGVYDLTNYATLARWPLAVTVADICWGAFICASTTAAAYAASAWLRA